jgi:putative effector of murein hydrolase
LWQRREKFESAGAALIVAAVVGGATAGGSAVALAWLLDMPSEVVRSLASKSVTAPVAMGIAERVGGVPALAAVFAVVTGLVGALSAKYLFNALGVDSWAVRGFALGTTSHGIGAARGAAGARRRRCVRRDRTGSAGAPGVAVDSAAVSLAGLSR